MPDKTFTAAEIARVFRNRSIDPDADFTATAGKDYGYVAAWELPSGGYILAYGNNGETNHDVVNDTDDLACWLESPDLSALDTIIQTANVRGIENVEEAAENAEGPFFIIRSRSYYGPIEESRFVETDDNIGGPMKFQTYAEAQEWIDNEEAETYCTAHNESGAPEYTIVTE